MKAFVAMDTTGIKHAKSFDLRYGGKDDEVISWQILGEGEQIVTCPMEGKMKVSTATAADTIPPTTGMTVSNPGARVADHPGQLKTNLFKDNIEWNPDPNKVDYNEVLFEDYFPPLKGKALVADRILSDPRCGIYGSVRSRGMQPFHQPVRDDPDEKVRIDTASCVNWLSLICRRAPQYTVEANDNTPHEGRHRMCERRREFVRKRKRQGPEGLPGLWTVLS